MDKRNNPKYIREFLVKNDLDVNLLERILEDIVDSEQLCSQDKHVHYLQISEGDESKEKEFWINNIDRFKHLYIYAMLFEWAEEWTEDSLIKDRFNKFQNDYKGNISTEINDFKSKVGIPITLIAEFKFITDAFLWIVDKKVPYCTLLEARNIDFFCHNYQRPKIRKQSQWQSQWQ